MSNCPGCWWADYSEKAPNAHNIYEEPDYLRMTNPNAPAPMMRVVKTCERGKKYFETFGNTEHDCPSFSDYATEERKYKHRVKLRAAKWKHNSERTKLPMTQNLLVLIERMYEGDNQAYEILIECMECAKDFGKFLLDLDDMNIRGTQIVAAFSYCDGDHQRFITAAKHRSAKMVQTVNTIIGTKPEEAVKEGARTFGHKADKAPAKPTSKPRITLADEGGGKATVVRRPVRRLRK